MFLQAMVEVTHCLLISLLLDLEKLAFRMHLNFGLLGDLLHLIQGFELLTFFFFELHLLIILDLLQQQHV
jgi:hypothetical protein